MALGKTVNKLLTNKYVLYIVLFLAITNVLGYLSVKDFKSLTIFAVIGLLTHYFSKNMIVILLTTMLATSFIMILERKSAIVEGLKNRKKNKEGMRKNKEGMKKKNKENLIDYASTVDETYRNINKQLGGEGMKKLTKETMNLMKQQKALQENMKNLEPLMNNAKKMMEGLDVSKITDLAKQFGGGKSSKE